MRLLRKGCLMKFTYNPTEDKIEVENTTAEDCLLDIIHLAIDYDGRRTVKGLKELIDELRALADTAITLGITEQKWETNLYEESTSYEEAKKAYRKVHPEQE